MTGYLALNAFDCLMATLFIGFSWILAWQLETNAPFLVAGIVVGDLADEVCASFRLSLYVSQFFPFRLSMRPSFEPLANGVLVYSFYR